MPGGTMKDGVCPRCGGHEVHCNAGWRVKARYSVLMLSWIRRAPLDDYVCVRCGSVERYVSRPDDLGLIAAKWRRVPARD